MLTAPFIPPAKSGGRRRTTAMHEVLNALLCIAASGCAWRLLQKCFPPVSTVWRYFYAWRDAGLFDAINMVLVMNLREIDGREASLSAGVTANRSKTTESGGICGYDAGKKIKGRKRHNLTDTCGFLVFVLVHAADIHRTAMAPSMCSGRYASAFLGCGISSRTAATPETSSETLSPAWGNGPSRS